MTREQAVITALAARGANRIDHPGGNLLDHLVRTSEVLRSWGSSRELVLAGLTHAAYGTDGFPTALYGLDERESVAAIVGDRAETVVHRYASCDRAFSYPRLATGSRLVRDRFDRSVVRLDEQGVRALAELTVANELDIARHSDRFRTEHGDALRRLVERWQPLLSECALEACRAILGHPTDDPATRHLVVDGIRLHARCWGSPRQPPIVLLHGGGLQARTWDSVCPALCGTYYCVALDLRGHGDSEWSPTLDYDVEHHARDVRGVIDELGLAQPIVIGHSLGAFAALQLATWRSHALRGLIIIDTSPFVRDSATLARLKAFMLNAGSFDTFDDALDYTLAFNPNRDRDRIRTTLLQTLRQRRDGTWTWKRDQRHLDERTFDTISASAHALLPAIRDITCPTLVVRGKHGLVAEDAERFTALLPNGTCTMVAAAGHNVQSDNPTGLLDAIIPFLACLTPQPSTHATW